MGVKGLSTFIDKNTHLLHSHKLKDCAVVIDGNNLYHQIYRACRIQSHFGGDYDVYRQQIIINFSSLLKCGIKPYVVFDGGYTTDNKKLRKCRERATQRIYNVRLSSSIGFCQLTPLLAPDTFLQALDELGIPHVTCQFEADNEIAKLANKLKCPVISNDSDFYVFNLVGGFLPLDYIDFNCLYKKNPDGSKYSYLHCRIYHVDEFINAFKGLTNELLPVFATMTGNDFFKPSDNFSKPSVPQVTAPKHNRNRRNKKKDKKKSKKVTVYSVAKKVSRVRKILDWFEMTSDDSNNVLDIIRLFIRSRRSSKKQFLVSVDGYFDVLDFDACDLFEYFSVGKDNFQPKAAATFSGYNGAEFPPWFLKSVCRGEITPAIINAAVLHRVIFLCQSENIQYPSSQNCSDYIRRVVYGILFASDSVCGKITQQNQCEYRSKYLQSMMKNNACRNDNVLSCDSEENELCDINAANQIDLICESNESDDDGETGSDSNCLSDGNGADPGSDGGEGEYVPESDEGEGEYVPESDEKEGESVSESDEGQGGSVSESDEGVGELVPKRDGGEVGCVPRNDEGEVGCVPRNDGGHTLISGDNQPEVTSNYYNDDISIMKQTQFEEYQREGLKLQKFYLEPVLTVGHMPLPTLIDIGDLDKEKRLSILLKALDVKVSFVNTFPPESLLFPICLNLWILHANPSVNEHHLDCVILCYMLLHMVKAKTVLSEKKNGETKVKFPNSATDESEITEETLTLSQRLDLESVCEENKTTAKFTNTFTNLDRYRTMKPDFSKRNPDFNKRNKFDCTIPHAFSQLQSIMFEVSNLNKLLRFPLPNIQPAFHINGTFLYNFYNHLITRPSPNLFIEAILMHGTDLHNVFLTIKSTVMDSITKNSLAPSGEDGKKKKKKSRGRKKGINSPSVCDNVEVEEESHSQQAEESDDEILVIDGFDIQNKFSLLLSM